MDDRWWWSLVGFVEKCDVVGDGEVGRGTLVVLLVALCQSVVLEPFSVTWYLLGDPAEWVSVGGIVMLTGWDWERKWW